MKQWYLIAGILGLGLLLYWLTNGLRQPRYNDEIHFWNASMLFALTGWPTRNLLISYGELNTPLPFMVFGWAENAFHGHIPGARLVNLVGGLATLLAIGVIGKKQPFLAGMAILGVLLNPYFYITALYLYTDCLPIFLVVLGLLAYHRGWYWSMAVAFGLAICGRQFMVIFPAGILLWEGVPALLTFAKKGHLPNPGQVRLLVTNALACGVLLAWRLFWGDWAQPSEVDGQHIATQSWHPEFALYGLACMGGYFALPLELMHRLVPPLRPAVPPALPVRATLLLVLAVGVLCSVYVIEPANQIVDLGPLERVLNRALRGVNQPQAIKQAVYAFFIVLALRRFRLLGLPGIWLVLQTVLWAKSHVGWDKYTYPLVVVYWFWLVVPAVTRSIPLLDVRREQFINSR